MGNTRQLYAAHAKDKDLTFIMRDYTAGAKDYTQLVAWHYGMPDGSFMESLAGFDDEEPLTTVNRGYIDEPIEDIHYAAFSEDYDITFVMHDYTYDEHEGCTEVVGWYYGEPDEALTQRAIESPRLTAEYDHNEEEV